MVVGCCAVCIRCSRNNYYDDTYDYSKPTHQTPHTPESNITIGMQSQKKPNPLPPRKQSLDKKDENTMLGRIMFIHALLK